MKFMKDLIDEAKKTHPVQINEDRVVMQPDNPIAHEIAVELEMLLKCLPQLEIQPATFQKAFIAARSRPGMGDLELSVKFHPYECEWMARITFSDNSEYKGTGETADVALKECVRLLNESPPTQSE